MPTIGKRIVVGTLYSGESEFEECLASIRRQSLPPLEHVILRHLPKREGHEALYREFAARSGVCDVFVKVDADMVILRDDLLERVAERFEADPVLDHVKVAVRDFFSRGLWGAINCYRSTCRWGALPDNLHTDVAPLNRRKADDASDDLAPAALHCANPSNFQAFHFGMHRGLKVHVAAREGRVMLVHKLLESIDLVWAHFLESQDPRVLLAAAGAEAAIARRLAATDVDYESHVAHEMCRQLESLGVGRLQRRVAWLRQRNRLGLPLRWRARQMALGWRALRPRA